MADEEQKKKKEMDPGEKAAKKAVKDKMKTLELKPIMLTGDYEDISDEAKELGEMMIKPAIFDRITLVVPKYPLMDIEEPAEGEDDSALGDCCRSYTKWCYLFFNWLTLWVYPFAVALKETLRFWGFMLYYFWVVPSRYINVYLCHPFLDGLYRCIRPPFVFCVILTRPCTAIISDICGACGEGFKRARS